MLDVHVERVEAGDVRRAVAHHQLRYQRYAMRRTGETRKRKRTEGGGRGGGMRRNTIFGGGEQGVCERVVGKDEKGAWGGGAHISVSSHNTEPPPTTPFEELTSARRPRK